MVNCSSGPDFLRLRNHFLVLAKNAEYMVSLCLYPWSEKRYKIWNWFNKRKVKEDKNSHSFGESLRLLSNPEEILSWYQSRNSRQVVTDIIAGSLGKILYSCNSLRQQIAVWKFTVSFIKVSEIPGYIFLCKLKEPFESYVLRNKNLCFWKQDWITSSTVETGLRDFWSTVHIGVACFPEVGYFFFLSGILLYSSCSKLAKIETIPKTICAVQCLIGIRLIQINPRFLWLPKSDTYLPFKNLFCKDVGFHLNHAWKFGKIELVSLLFSILLKEMTTSFFTKSSLKEVSGTRKAFSSCAWERFSSCLNGGPQSWITLCCWQSRRIWVGFIGCTFAFASIFLELLRYEGF